MKIYTLVKLRSDFPYTVTCNGICTPETNCPNQAYRDALNEQWDPYLTPISVRFDYCTELFNLTQQELEEFVLLNQDLTEMYPELFI